MDGQPYRPYARRHVRLFVLDSNYLHARQVAWIGGARKAAAEPWEICDFLHPLYSDGGRHGSEVDLRVKLESLFVKYGVNVVYSAHDHLDECVKPGEGIAYFVYGAGGQLRQGHLKRSALTAAGFDQDTRGCPSPKRPRR
jgi:hypothetical protein